MINEKQTFSRLDMVFARFLSERSSLDSSQKPAFENLVMSLSFQQNQGHSCIHLDNDGKALILASGLALSVTNSSDVNTTLPLIIEQNRLYLHRYWYYENRLAQQLRKMTDLKLCDQLKTTTETLLDKYFGITATIS